MASTETSSVGGLHKRYFGDSAKSRLHRDQPAVGARLGGGRVIFARRDPRNGPGLTDAHHRLYKAVVLWPPAIVYLRRVNLARRARVFQERLMKRLLFSALLLGSGGACSGAADFE